MTLKQPQDAGLAVYHGCRIQETHRCTCHIQLENGWERLGTACSTGEELTCILAEVGIAGLEEDLHSI